MGDLSITHIEYRHAKERGLPVLGFIKGDRSVKREPGTDGLLKELDGEALVNAVAHRQYAGGGHEGRKIMLEVFADRVVVSSPGLPPTPITIDKLRKGILCSARN